MVAEVEVVGVIREVTEIGANGEPTLSHTYLTVGFLETHPELAELQLPGIGGFVRLAAGADPGAFVADVRDGFPRGEDGTPMGFVVALDAPNPVEPAMKALSVGLWGLAGVLAAATAITFAASMSRQVAASDADGRIMVGLGVDRAGLVASTSLLGIGAAAAGTLVAVVVAAGLSTVHLIGVAEKVEPEPGFDLDPSVVAIGAAVAFVYATAVTALTAWRASTRSRQPASARPGGTPGLVDRIVRIGAPPWAALGTDYALGRGRGIDGAIPARLAVAGVIAGTTGLVAVLIFGIGVRQATEDPSVYGWGDWEARVDMDVLDPEVDPAAIVGDDPAVATVAGLSLRFDLPIDGVTVAGTPARQFVGETGPTVIRGRLPSGAEEIGLGIDTADRLGVDVGDTVRIDGPSGTGDLRVVGLLVVPSVDSEPITQGWHLDREALDAVGFEPGCNSIDCYQSLAVSWRPGADVDAATARLEEVGLRVVLPEPGPEVILISHADQLPSIAAIGVGLLAVIGLVHTLAVTVRRRRRDLAVGRALGFRPRQSAAVLLTEGLALGVVGAAVGGLLGTIVGRAVWRTAATAMGIGSQLPPTTGLVAAVVISVVVLSVLAAVIPAVQAARLRPADGLRSS